MLPQNELGKSEAPIKCPASCDKSRRGVRDFGCVAAVLPGEQSLKPATLPVLVRCRSSAQHAG